MGKSIRIRTTPGGGDKFVSVKIDQDFDFLEVLSIKIRQEEVYRQYCADYGVLVGRVLLNDGFGAANCKVSIFIPIDDTDIDNDSITALYPYKSPTDHNTNFIRYNLLPDHKQNKNHIPVGTFPSKRRVINHDVTLYVYDKYYKFTTTTNTSGDFMIFGIPTGNHEVHFDLDLSDMGSLSLSPADLVASGIDEDEFTTVDLGAGQTGLKFKTNTNLNILPQIKSTNIQVNIKPFWGDKDQCVVGITRLDWNVRGQFTPSAIFFGGSFTETDRERLGRDWAANVASPPNRCEMNGNGNWSNNMRTETGTVTYKGLRENDVDHDGESPINSNGNWIIILPMLEGKIKTDESGNLIPSPDDTGIPTYGDYRFQFGLDNMNWDLPSRNARAIAFCPQYSMQGQSFDFNAFYNFSQPPYCSTSDTACFPIAHASSTNSTTKYGYLKNKYTNYYRFHAGRSYTLEQWVAHPNYNEDPLTIAMHRVGQQASNQNPYPANAVWLTGALFMGKRVSGSYYFMQFNISKGGLHCEAAIWGKSTGTGNNKDPGQRRSAPPYCYRTDSQGATYVEDLTEIDNPSYDFFTSKGFAPLPSQLQPTSHGSPGVVNATNAQMAAANTIYGKFWYFGLHQGNSSFDEVVAQFQI